MAAGFYQIYYDDNGRPFRSKIEVARALGLAAQKPGAQKPGRAPDGQAAPALCGQVSAKDGGMYLCVLPAYHAGAHKVDAKYCGKRQR